jgi:crossover junction endodeoxyribonuclease RusA
VTLTIRVYGRPAPQGSKEQGGAGQLLEASPYLPAWRVAVKVAAYKAYEAAGIPFTRLPLYPRGVPVIIDRLHFYVTDEQCRAEGTDEPIGDPDIDKLLRATLDPLGGAKERTARLFKDDAQVMGIKDLWKFRAGPASPPGALIIVSDGRDRQ